MRKKVVIVGALALLALQGAEAGVRYSINNAWSFEMPDREGWTQQTVNLPHTWNAQDAVDDEPGYYRGRGCYERTLNLGAEAEGKKVYLRVDGANQVATVAVNGHEAGRHEGGYTAFRLDITPWIQPGTNILQIEVDNSHNEDIPPLAADYSFFGGLYRDVVIELEEPIHISNLDNASSGIYISYHEVDSLHAKMKVDLLIDNHHPTPQKAFYTHQLIDPEGSIVAQLHNDVSLAPSSTMTRFDDEMVVENPRLWSPDAPNLYQLLTIVRDEKGEELDRQIEPVGFRWYSFDAYSGFYLNGKRLKLIGTNRHQDFKGRGWALTSDLHEQDLRMIKDMGANFLRVSHYPQDPRVLELCDQLGLIATVEIPIVNRITESEAFLANCLTMQEEMVKQAYNHPSVVAWAYMNEVMLQPRYERKDPRFDAYCREVERQARAIDSLTRQLDPERYTMIPCSGDLALYEQAGVVATPMIVGWNLYPGWYGGEVTGLEEFLSTFHQRHPSTPTILTEYGADCDTRLHSLEPRRYDYTMEYAWHYHDHYLDVIESLDYLAGANAWNFNDFHSESRENATPHYNVKGLVATDRRPKDLYHFYQARLAKKPMVAFSGQEWTRRHVALDSSGVARMGMRVYSNRPWVRVTHDGREIANGSPLKGYLEIAPELHDGLNRLVAITDSATATLDIEVVGVAPGLDPSTFTQLNVMLGSSRYFHDPESGLSWMPDQEYTPERGWGYVGGEPLKVANWAGQLPASDIGVLTTTLDPLYQTARCGLSHFKADVAPGRYAVYLHWADLSKETYEALAYALGNDAIHEESDNAMRVEINGKTVRESLDVRQEVGRQHPLDLRVDVEVSPSDTGIDIALTPQRGTTILHAVRIVKL